MFTHFVPILFLVVLGAVSAKYQDLLGFPNEIPPTTVSSVNLTSYLGRWYQVYSSFVANRTFEKDGYCITADYTAVSDTLFNLTNAQAIGSPSGSIDTISGQSELKDPSQLGKWVITLENGPKIFDRNIYGFYWIIELGPLNANGLYSYSVVSSPFGITLFVLARDVTEFRTTYEQDVLARLDQRGFKTPFNRPLPTYQESDCNYQPVP